MDNLEHGVGFAYSIKTVPQIQQDGGNGSGYGVSHLKIGFFLTLILLVATLCLLGYGIKNAKVHNYKLIEVGIIEYLLLLVFMVFASCLVVLNFAFAFVAQIIFVFCFIFAISTPLIGTFNPQALLFAIHMPISATCKHHQHHKKRVKFTEKRS